MACADVDMDIHGDEEETHRAGRRESPIVRHYQATELMPGVKGPLHDLLQKQPAVLGVRLTELCSAYRKINTAMQPIKTKHLKIKLLKCSDTGL